MERWKHKKRKRYLLRDKKYKETEGETGNWIRSQNDVGTNKQLETQNNISTNIKDVRENRWIRKERERSKEIKTGEKLIEGQTERHWD